ncbi:Methyltransferase [Gracilaria domingensis]|nr:Methyltransferase [Gracilaria domingensis]
MVQTPPPSRALNLLIPHADTICSLLHHRIYSPKPPSHFDPLTVEFLRGIPDSVLGQVEVHGACKVLPDMDIPPFLRSLTNLAADVSHYFPSLENLHDKQTPQMNDDISSSKSCSKRRIKLAKLHQIESVMNCATYITSQASPGSIQRVIDVGAGHAHLAANLGTILDLPTVAIDRDLVLIQTAEDLYGTIPNLTLCGSAIETLDSRALEVTENDMLVGLHSCGSLGEMIVKTAVDKQVAAVFLVSCCLQKLSPSATFRQPLSDVVLQEPQLRKLLETERRFLGATNRSRNVSQNSKKARVTRYALRALLADRGMDYQPGDEVASLSRHMFKHGLLHVSHKFLETCNVDLRLEAKEATERMKAAASEYREMQALNIPRAIAGEILEMAILLDRASMLEKTFPTVRTMRVWPESISVKNLAIAAWK